MAEPLISDVSDTARWVAAFRAWETARPDAIFADPYADRLAGDLGHAIANSNAMPKAARNGWSIIARTKLIDDLIAKSVAEGCDRVLYLAAGLDTRPYRLELPESLEWIEADLPAMTAEKEVSMAGETPRCRLVRKAVDLADPKARKQFLDEATGGAQKTVVITEGLLIYLDEADVRAIATDLAGAGIHWWILDIASAAILKSMNRRGGQLANAPMKFGPANGIAYFEDLGWHVDDVESLYDAAARWNRLPRWMKPLRYLPQPNPRKPGRAMWGGVVRLSR